MYGMPIFVGGILPFRLFNGLMMMLTPSQMDSLARELRKLDTSRRVSRLF